MRRLVVGLAIGIASFAPSWATANDEQIAKTIVEKLEARKKQGQLKGFNIDLKVDKGTVWLSGQVASADQQQLAIDAARRVEGVEAVVNDLQVKKPSAVAKSGPAKSATAKSEKSEESGAVRPSLFTKLFGSSPKKQEPTPAKSPTTQLAKAERGPKSARASQVDTQVKPVMHEDAPAEANKNEALIEALAAKLNEHKQAGKLKDFDINLSADNGVVTVTGEVADAMQRDLILGTIRRTSGVAQVVNLLGVAAEPVAQAAPEPIRSEPAPTPAPAQPAVESPRPIARLVPQRAAEHPVVPAVENDDPRTAGSVIPTAGPPQPPALQPIPAPQGPVQVAGSNGVAYTAYPVQTAPAPFHPAPGYSQMPAAPHMAQRPLAFAPAGGAAPVSGMQAMPAVPQMPAHMPGPGFGAAPARFDHPNMPGYAWPSYASHPNYAAVTYPKQYSASAWPYMGPFYPYPQVPLGWRKVSLQWDDGWWFLDFKDK